MIKQQSSTSFLDFVLNLLKGLGLALILLTMSADAQTTGEFEAIAKVKELWGNYGFARYVGINYQIGCTLNTGGKIIWSSKVSYADALSEVDLSINGKRVLTAEASDTSGNVGYSEPVPVYVCNK